MRISDTPAVSPEIMAQLDKCPFARDCIPPTEHYRRAYRKCWNFVKCETLTRPLNRSRFSDAVAAAEISKNRQLSQNW